MSVQKIGIDAGGSLIKMVYVEEGRNHFKTFPISQLESAMKWLKITAPTAQIALTGGKAAFLHHHYFTNAIQIPEFQAACEGARFFLALDGNKLESCILVNIGTGTSWFFLQGDKQERILGSGIGGGTFMGLGELLTGESGFSNLVHMSLNGNKGKVDLTVSDIYMGEDTPVAGNLTASNFAKGRTDEQSSQDLMASVTNMIAETIVLLTLQATSIYQTQDVVYMGSTLAGNEPLKKVLESYKGMLGLNTRFLKNGEYSGAMGAMLSL
ncbi:type II pantothenate kinase [Bacillus sp. CGMCC 1.16607]|uniref:type II pantothenate kinase n=1 Tax=Bacillus sp. CGMCC 1.16607 TaxID=3351842 RepID=UPI00364460EA